jgi:hypothetical protein
MLYFSKHETISHSFWRKHSLAFIRSIAVITILHTVNPRYKGLVKGRQVRVSVIPVVRYNRVNRDSWKYITGYTANTRNKYRNTQCDYIKIFILGFFFVLNIFITTKPSYYVNISKNSQLHIARFCSLCTKSIISTFVLSRVYCTTSTVYR